MFYFVIGSREREREMSFLFYISFKCGVIRPPPIECVERAPHERQWLIRSINLDRFVCEMPKKKKKEGKANKRYYERTSTNNNKTKKKKKHEGNKTNSHLSIVQLEYIQRSSILLLLLLRILFICSTFMCTVVSLV